MESIKFYLLHDSLNDAANNKNQIINQNLFKPNLKLQYWYEISSQHFPQPPPQIQLPPGF